MRNDWQFYRDRRPESYDAGPGLTAVSDHDAASRAARSSARPARRAQDVLIDGETIAALLAPGSTLLGATIAAPTRVIDATGKYVIPGGIDAHTHMEMPFGGTSPRDTFETGTRAAAWGGTTTIVDFVVQTHGQRVQDQVGALARQGRRQLRDRLRLPPDHRRRRTTSRSRRWTS